MKVKAATSSARKSDWKFNLFVFAISFIVLGLLFTLQMVILAGYINYVEIPTGRAAAIFICWLVAAAAVTVGVIYQIEQRYRKPMKIFAEAAQKVAGGDFSVYVSPRNRADKYDHLDLIFIDFNRMVEELGSIETLKTDFFSNVSHEIKTPLSAIQNYAEMLCYGNTSDEQRLEYAGMIVKSTCRLSELITNLLKLNKLEKQSILPDVTVYDLNRQLCECALLFEERWEQNNIDFIIDVEEEATIEGDASLLELVWNNLLSNAFKFTPPNGTVTLIQKTSGDDVMVSVIDTGCGMSEATIDRIFEKFYQGDTSHSTEGNGLGLALCLRIITLLDGRITASSRVGEGSTFTVYLPLKRKLGM